MCKCIGHAQSRHFKLAKRKKQPFGIWIDKQNIAYMYNEILLNFIKE